ncbi:MAG: glycosyltransferase, partial [Thiohalospira sp.]
MRILHVETGRHLYGGAAQVLYLLEGLARSGCESHLACPADSAIVKAARDAGIPVHDTGRGGDLAPAMALRLRRLLGRLRPDLVHVHSRRGADPWGGLAARWAGVPAVLSRRVDNPEPRWWAARK